MKDSSKLKSITNDYGSKGQNWNDDFVAYMTTIANSPNFEGMPDAFKEDGKIQWEAPSNRKSGKYKETHHLRREWWQNKAKTIGINTDADAWISKVAKRIHPTGLKPCKRCGRVLQIAYVYPNKLLEKRLVKVFGDDFEIQLLEPITELMQRIADQFGQEQLAKFKKVLKTNTFCPPQNLKSLEEWVTWLEDEYTPSEPSLLSPGAMSNAPDRFDGFHSFNLCCRKKADKGRHDTNMMTYTTDRRVFEYWSDGDWIAADRLMGLVSSCFRQERCADNGIGPPSADHIGPISLGFCHRPMFRLLSKQANSAKNNRMTLQDVQELRQAELKGEEVISWYSKPLWDLRKDKIETDEHALRLSKQLRDNQRVAMHMLHGLLIKGHTTFLSSLLHLSFAEMNVEFKDLKIINFLTDFSSILKSQRETKYANIQKTRRLRIGFSALVTYGAKENRHTSFLDSVFKKEARQNFEQGAHCLKTVPDYVIKLDKQLNGFLASQDARAAEYKIRDIVPQIPNMSAEPTFRKAHSYFRHAMDEVGTQIDNMWEEDRYVRAVFTED